MSITYYKVELQVTKINKPMSPLPGGQFLLKHKPDKDGPHISGDIAVEHDGVIYSGPVWLLVSLSPFLTDNID